MRRAGDGTLTPVGYYTPGRVYPRSAHREYWLPYERSLFQKVPSARLSAQYENTYVLASAVPIFYPVTRFVSHTSSFGPFVYPDSMGAAASAPEEIGDVVTIYSDYEASSGNYIILADCSVDSNNIIIYLPDVLTVDELELQFKKIDATAYTVTIQPYGTDEIDGQSNVVLTAQDEVLSVVADADEPEWQTLNVLP